MGTFEHIYNSDLLLVPSYRPISLLANNNIFEKIVYKRICSFLDRLNFIERQIWFSSQTFHQSCSTWHYRKDKRIT